MRRVTVKDLANELGVSLSTINKALTGKPGVSEETRRHIMDTADRMGYQVNRVAQSLARNPIKIGIIMPEAWPEYYGSLKCGIDQELENLRDYNILGKYYMVPGLHSGLETVEAINRCIIDGINAVIICPVYDSNYLEQIENLYENGIPVIALGADLFDAKRLCCIRVNAQMSGKLAAEYMRWIIGEGKFVAVFIGNKDFCDHKEKVDGFVEEARNNSLKIAGVFETHDEPEVAYYLAGKLIKERQDLGGIYIATGNSIAVCKYIVENNIKNMRIIGTDIFKDIIKFVKDGVMQGVIFQDPVTQGRTAVKVIYDKLVKNISVEDSIFITPQIVLRNNIDSYRSKDI